jgi:hypothetical protein
MPVEDNCQQLIVQALNKAGWGVLRTNLLILFHNDTRRLYVDLYCQRLGAGKSDNILIEVKCFSKGTLEEYYSAIGQYMVYRQAMKLKKVPHPLYLAIPHKVYLNLFQQDALYNTWKDAKLKLLTVDLRAKEIRQWIQ